MATILGVAVGLACRRAPSRCHVMKSGDGGLEVGHCVRHGRRTLRIAAEPIRPSRGPSPLHADDTEAARRAAMGLAIRGPLAA